MTRKRTLLFPSLIILVAAIGYTGLRVWLEIGDKTLGVRRGSTSETDSRDAGFYIGTYVPTKRLFALNTPPSVLHVPDAWVEHAWKRDLSFFLRKKKQVTDGYFFYIPIPADESSEGRKPTWEFGFGLELKQVHGTGFGFDSGLGFVALLDTLPQTLSCAVKQKQRGFDGTNQTVVTDTIEFKRAF